MKKVDETEKRINEILNSLQEAAAGNLNVSIPISKKADNLDALAAGINMMIEEVKERAKELEQKTKELKRKNEELEGFNKIAVGRELKMIELKKRIEELEDLLAKHGIKTKSDNPLLKEKKV